MTEAERIASKLTEAQRRDLIRLSHGEHRPGWSIFNLIRKGLAVYKRRWRFFGPKVVRLTPLGLQVRAVLEGEG